LFETILYEEEIMLTLVPMQQEDFDRLLENEIRNYAADQLRNGNWPGAGSLERSRKEFEALLPDGVHTQDQYIWSLMEENNKVGYLWVQVKDDKAFIYNFLIREEFRGQGFGKQALAAMDEWLTSVGAESVSLHVFGDNLTAQGLYRKMGFEVTDLHMRKEYR